MENDTTFFDYSCDNCSTPVCERIQVINLALDYTEDIYCIPCLTQQEGTTPEALLQIVKPYIQSRDCFRKPWNNFVASACPYFLAPQNTQICYCQ